MYASNKVRLGAKYSATLAFNFRTVIFIAFGRINASLTVDIERARCPGFDHSCEVNAWSSCTVTCLLVTFKGLISRGLRLHFSSFKIFPSDS
jgi:hypothetical protein